MEIAISFYYITPRLLHGLATAVELSGEKKKTHTNGRLLAAHLFALFPVPEEPYFSAGSPEDLRTRCWPAAAERSDGIQTAG